MPDNVNHPAHYETNGIECIDAMVASQGVDSVMSYCLCNASTRAIAARIFRRPSGISINGTSSPSNEGSRTLPGST